MSLFEPHSYRTDRSSRMYATTTFLTVWYAFCLDYVRSSNLEKHVINLYLSAYLPTTPFPFRRFRSVKRQCRCKYLLSYEGISGNLSLLNFPRLTLLLLSLSFTLSPPPPLVYTSFSLQTWKALHFFFFFFSFSSSGFVLKPQRNLYLLSLFHFVAHIVDRK